MQYQNLILNFENFWQNLNAKIFWGSKAIHLAKELIKLSEFLQNSIKIFPIRNFKFTKFCVQILGRESTSAKPEKVNWFWKSPTAAWFSHFQFKFCIFLYKFSIFPNFLGGKSEVCEVQIDVHENAMERIRHPTRNRAHSKN